MYTGMSACESVRMCAGVCGGQKGAGSSRARVAGRREPPDDVSVGNQIPDLWKSSKYSSPLSISAASRCIYLSS